MTVQICRIKRDNMYKKKQIEKIISAMNLAKEEYEKEVIFIEKTRLQS